MGKEIVEDYGMPRGLEIAFFAVMIGAAALGWPWNAMMLAIVIPGTFIWGAVVVFTETREWMRRRRLRRSAWL